MKPCQRHYLTFIMAASTVDVTIMKPIYTHYIRSILRRSNLLNRATGTLWLQKAIWKIKSHPWEVAFKWSRGDKVLLPALSGVVKTIVLTLQRYELFPFLPNKSRFILSFFSKSSLVSKIFLIFALKYWLIVVTRRCYGRSLSLSGGAGMILLVNNSISYLFRDSWNLGNFMK